MKEGLTKLTNRKNRQTLLNHSINPNPDNALFTKIPISLNNPVQNPDRPIRGLALSQDLDLSRIYIFIPSLDSILDLCPTQCIQFLSFFNRISGYNMTRNKILDILSRLILNFFI